MKRNNLFKFVYFLILGPKRLKLNWRSYHISKNSISISKMPKIWKIRLIIKIIIKGLSKC